VEKQSFWSASPKRRRLSGFLKIVNLEWGKKGACQALCCLLVYRGVELGSVFSLAFGSALAIGMVAGVHDTRNYSNI